ncbi:MAG TPA: acyl-CoA dehydrogenase family protein [Gammaproteobacteria bacterium]|nr:acyl-CoA dehydrogenase family protein [Gammaproteobacteria bacterium]
MDFDWSEEQIARKRRVIEFARANLSKDVARRDRDGEFPIDDWRRCADFGILSYPVPSAYSGRDGVDFLSAMLAMEGLGYACADNGLTFALNAQMWTVQLPIVQFGTDQQKRRYLPGLCGGTMIGAHAITEPDSGSDVFSMKASAKRVPGGYLLNGTKKFVSLGPVADVALVFATLNADLGRWGVTAFLVDRTTPGYTAGPVAEKMGLRTVPIGELEFKDCLIPEECRLGPEGAGTSLSTSSLEWERCCILASQLGSMERQLEEGVRYARDRRQFGQPIGKFQSVANRLVDMKLRLETSRLLLYKVAWLKQSGRSAMLEAALLKLHLAEAFVASSLDAIRLHGGHGYMTVNEVERDLRDAVGGVIYAGTSDIQRNIVAALLGL